MKSNELRGVLQRYFESDAAAAATDARLPYAGRRRVEGLRAPARQPRRSRRRLSPVVRLRLSQATTLVVVNAAAAFEVCKLANPPLWLALLAGVGLARVESELVRLHHRSPSPG